jgi:hypothetical protein
LSFLYREGSNNYKLGLQLRDLGIHVYEVLSLVT